MLCQKQNVVVTQAKLEHCVQLSRGDETWILHTQKRTSIKK